MYEIIKNTNMVNPKSETLNPKQTQNPKHETQNMMFGKFGF
jgi:hypothetical protein